jgi:four helix bundle protein
VWQAAIDLGQNVYELTAKFPRSELYGLTSQVRRSVVSVASNIAEGHARDSTKEYLRFPSIARGSLAETETQLIIAERLELAPARDVSALLTRADEISKMLRRLPQALERKA